MEFEELILYVVIALVYIMILRACTFMLDIHIINKLFSLDRERKKLAEELKLSLSKDEDREKINKKIAHANIFGAIWYAFAGVVAYFIIMKIK